MPIGLPHPTPPLWISLMSVVIFIISYGFVIAEEYTHFRKSKPMLIAAGLLWILLGYAEKFLNWNGHVHELYEANLLEYANLFLFLFVSMVYVKTLEQLNVFEKLKSYLIQKGMSYQQLFWTTGLIAFFLSPIADNLTTALVMGAILIAVGKDNQKFIALGCINIVVAANAGGAFCPFGDITTLMVWQQGVLGFSLFFKLFIPSLVNFLVPAYCMSFAIDRGLPSALEEDIQFKDGAKISIVLFLLTITTSVVCHHFLGLPPTFGMMVGLGYLQIFSYFLKLKSKHKPGSHQFDIFKIMESLEWDTLLFFYGVMLCVGALSALGLLNEISHLLYDQLGSGLSLKHQATPAHIIVGLCSSILDNIPVMAAVLKMNINLPEGQWLLVTLTAGVGGSLLSVGSAAGVALMGQAPKSYTFFSHLRWSWAIALGYVLSILTHFWLNAGTF
jgi:Na+/H+ antiporter NhaD/arsenite permease-like protein